MQFVRVSRGTKCKYADMSVLSFIKHYVKKQLFGGFSEVFGIFFLVV